MAKIFGVEIKNVKSYLDHEGCTIHSGDVYIDGKKIGSWRDGYMGESPYFQVGSNYGALVERADRFYSICKSKHKDISIDVFKGDPEILVCELVKLKEREKQFKRSAKNGYDSMLIIESDSFTGSIRYNVRGVHANWETRFKKYIDEAKAQFPAWSEPEAKYVRGMDDFIIDERTSSYVV